MFERLAAVNFVLQGGRMGRRVCIQNTLLLLVVVFVFRVALNDASQDLGPIVADVVQDYSKRQSLSQVAYSLRR